MKYIMYCPYCGWEHSSIPEDDSFFDMVSIHLESCGAGRIEIRLFERCPIVIKVNHDQYQCILPTEHEEDHEISLLEHRRLSVLT